MSCGPGISHKARGASYCKASLLLLLPLLVLLLSLVRMRQRVSTNAPRRPLSFASSRDRARKSCYAPPCALVLLAVSHRVGPAEGGHSECHPLPLVHWNFGSRRLPGVRPSIQRHQIGSCQRYLKYMQLKASVKLRPVTEEIISPVQQLKRHIARQHLPNANISDDQRLAVGVLRLHASRDTAASVTATWRARPNNRRPRESAVQDGFRPT